MCEIGTAGISEFSHLLNLGVDPDIRDKVLCSKHCSVCYQLLVTSLQEGWFPLWYASDHARADLLQLLIEYRADVNLTMNDVRTHCYDYL